MNKLTKEQIKQATEIARQGLMPLSGVKIDALKQANRVYKLKLGRGSVDREKLKKVIKIKGVENV